MKTAYFRLPVNLTGPVEIGIYETPVNLVLKKIAVNFMRFVSILQKIDQFPTCPQNRYVESCSLLGSVCV